MVTYQRFKCGLYSIVVCWLLVGCSKNITDYYNPQSTLDKNIIEVLEADGRFSSFVSIIDRVGLRSTLGEAAIYTCLAPLDEHVNAYFNQKGYESLSAVPEDEIRKFINYHFINGMYYKYDLQRRYLSANSEISKSRSTQYRSRTEDKMPGKAIKVFTPSFFQNQPTDYAALFEGDNGELDFMVEGARISDEDQDIDARNGVIHVLETPLIVLPRTDEALAGDPETSIFSSWLEKHVQYVLGGKDETGWVDTTLYKSYSIGRNLADESILSTLLVPTDEAILDYFEPYMDIMDNTIDSVPREVMYSLLRASIISDFWYESDLIRLEPEWRTFTARPFVVQDIPNAIVGSVPASNSVIYKVDRVIEPPVMHSVQGGILMKHKAYSQWYWMFEYTNLEAGLMDPISYQHSQKTILVQPDDVWEGVLASDMMPEEREFRLQQCRSGILNLDIRQDGGFRKRFYGTDFGYILYDEEAFYDHTGHSVRLLRADPVWERGNGAIFEIDGFLTPVDKLDITQTVYAKINADPELSTFASAIERAGLATALQLTGFFTYTLFAPTNAALDNAGIAVDEMPVDDLARFVNTYIVQNRYIFTDGVFNGQIANKNGDRLRMEGAWDSFHISDANGQSIPVTKGNIQGNNGVIHKINQLF